jgi:Tfp pilus assembly protein PilN
MIYLKTGIGIELRGPDMLIASLQSNFSGRVFTHFRRIVDYPLRKTEDLRQEVNLFFRSNRLSKDNIVLGISRKDVVLRYLDLPTEVADNLKQVVDYQVQSFEPVEEDRSYYDYILLDGNGMKKRLSVLLLMVRKAFLDDQLQFLANLGIRPVAVTAGSIALSNIFLQNRKDFLDKTYMLADLASSSMELLALHKGALAYSREIPKESVRSWGDQVLLEVDEAASKIRLGPEGVIEKIVLSGESSDLAYEQIRSVIPECDLMRNYLSCQTPEENKIHLQEAGTALGLAYTGTMRRPPLKANLLPSGLRVHQTRWAYAPAALLGLSILLLLIALGFHSMAQDQMLVGVLDQEISTLKAPVERIQAVQTQTEAMEKRISSIEALLRKKDMNLEALRELTNILPADTFLNTYRYSDDLIQIAGSSGSASDLVPRLEKSPLFKDVVQKGPIFKDAQTGKDRFSFEMKLER